jgi:hypothetical protein
VNARANASEKGGGPVIVLDSSLNGSYPPNATGPSSALGHLISGAIW